jgi:hypothetical protein
MVQELSNPPVTSLELSYRNVKFSCYFRSFQPCYTWIFDFLIIQSKNKGACYTRVNMVLDLLVCSDSDLRYQWKHFSESKENLSCFQDFSLHILKQRFATRDLPMCSVHLASDFYNTVSTYVMKNTWYQKTCFVNIISTDNTCCCEQLSA